ncbi:hypothetical protein E8E13_003394 [Curvularia kusanoi]|uniref:Ankyrin repeat protein n=1 Tax=Curvularia kusanoi TaxID=90978 RepID=A0A9P4W936_CURKU|nr:hypothetical protein E8E13_003394 [Curvularia kusanoi]
MPVDTFVSYAARFLLNTSFRPGNCTKHDSYLKLASVMLDPTSEPFHAWHSHANVIPHYEMVGFTDAILVASYLGLDNVVDFLLKGNVDIESRDAKYKRTSLLWATSMNHHKVVELLLQNGANANVQTRHDGYVLDVAVRRGFKTVVGLLLENGAKSISALQLAAYHGHHEIAELLLAHGADVNHRDDRYWSALGAAICHDEDKTDLVRLFLDWGTDINIVIDGRTALEAAAHYNNLNVAELLLQRGANMNIEDGEYGRSGQMLLHIASSRGELEIAKQLLDLGADANAPDESGCTALEIALRWNHPEIVELLR